MSAGDWRSTDGGDPDRSTQIILTGWRSPAMGLARRIMIRLLELQVKADFKKMRRDIGEG